MSISIEKNIPVKKGTTSFYGEALEAFGKMDNGDSFLCELKDRNNVYNASKSAGCKVLTRKQSNNKLRVWKI